MKQIHTQWLSKRYPWQVIFENLTFRIKETDRIALVGPNGAGKTSLFKILAGLDEPSEGTVTREENMRIGYLAQVHPKKNQTLFDALMESFCSYESYCIVKETEQHLDDPAQFERWQQALHTFETLGGFQHEATAKAILTSIDFPETDWTRDCESLSGGQRVRLAFGQILCDAPDFFLLDEPTNFLDLESIEWIEHYLKNTWKKGFLIISHDRYFLESLCPITWELVPQRGLDFYFCSYTQYLTQKHEKAKNEWKKYYHDHEERERQKEIVRRLNAWSRANMSQSREKALEKLPELHRPYTPRTMSLEFKEWIRSNEEIFLMKEVMIGYTDPLFMVEEISLRRKQRIALMGKNGAGKSTFFKVLLSQLAPLDGYVQWRENTQIAYYSQKHEHLHEDKTVLDETMDTLNIQREQARALLWAFDFVADQVFTKIRSLSGGERSRLALCLLSHKPSNVLLLDEPTNHLDFRLREALEKALRHYPGTILFISHDRYFINKVATHLWHIEDGLLHVSTGNYDDWLRKNKRFDDKYRTENSLQAEELMARIEKLGEDMWRQRLKDGKWEID